MIKTTVSTVFARDSGSESPSSAHVLTMPGIPSTTSEPGRQESDLHHHGYICETDTFAVDRGKLSEITKEISWPFTMPVRIVSAWLPITTHDSARPRCSSTREVDYLIRRRKPWRISWPLQETMSCPSPQLTTADERIDWYPMGHPASADAGVCTGHT